MCLYRMLSSTCICIELSRMLSGNRLSLFFFLAIESKAAVVLICCLAILHSNTIWIVIETKIQHGTRKMLSSMEIFIWILLYNTLWTMSVHAFVDVSAHSTPSLGLCVIGLLE